MATFLLALLFPVSAFANQTPASSTGTNPVTKTYPSTLDYDLTVAGPAASVNSASIALNGGSGVVTSAQLSPGIAANTNATDILVSAAACVLATPRCLGRGTVTIEFNRAVTNPVLHISGLGGASTGSGVTSYFASSLNLVSWVANGTPTLTRTAGTTNFTVVGGTEIRNSTIDGATACNVSPVAGCGSVRINGTVSSVTFRIDMLMAGTTNPRATSADAFTITASVDEDFGDAPASYQASPVASHIVGGLYLGASVTADNVGVTNGGALAASPIANATASTDGGDNGVTLPTLRRNTPATIDVAVTGAGGQLQGWIDWADDGNFTTAGDQIAVNAVDGGSGDADGVTNGIIRVAVTPPAAAALTATIARFRLSSVSGVGINGMVPDGEVEDYELTVLPAQADLSLTKTVSNSTPSSGVALSYNLTVTSAASPGSNGTATGITVQDTLPAGFTFVSATGTGTYTSATGVWAVGSLAPGASASITINGLASGALGSTVTNVAQISASSLTDPDSTVNNGVTTEDDYASASFTTAALVVTCPTGSTATGSGYPTTGTGANLNQIFWLDWNCGSTTQFPTGSTISKSWIAGDGLVITGSLTGITFPIRPYITGEWAGDALDDLYSGVNPVGLLNVTAGQDPQFNLNLTATLNGVPVPLRYVTADAEALDGTNEALVATTNGSAWQLLEQSGTINVVNSGTSFTLTDATSAGSGTAILETTATNLTIGASITAGGSQAFAFGFYTPFDYSDAPLSGTSYGAVRHRTIAPIRLGPSFTTEAAAYDSPNASADVDNGVTLPGSITAGQPFSVDVLVNGPGFLSAWVDWNDDGDFADSGEQVATNAVDGGAGDADAAVNATIRLAGTVPAGATPTALTISRFRYSSASGVTSSGVGAFGEVEDYPLAIAANALLSVDKTSTPYNDGTNPVFNLPGQDVVYSIAVTNTLAGTTTSNTILVVDPLPANMTFFNGDANGALAGTDPVYFTNAASGLTYSYATDVRFMNGSTQPASFAGCTYTPTAGYDPNVRYICVNPKGVMNGTATTPTPRFTISFRARIN